MDDITLQQIRTFLTVADRLSITAAAKDLYVDPAAVSRRIKSLENALGILLFKRVGRGMELTPEGKQVYLELKPLNETLSDSLQNLSSIISRKGMILRIVCLDSPTLKRMLEPAFDTFQETHPGVILKRVYKSFKDLRESLLYETADCVITYSLGFAQYRDIKIKKIAKLNSFFAISSKSSAAKNTAVNPKALSGKTLVMRSVAEMKEPEERALDICRAYGFEPAKIRYMPSYQSLASAVRNDEGFTISDGRFGTEFGSEIKLFLIDKPITNQYLIVSWRNYETRQVTREFIAFISKYHLEM